MQKILILTCLVLQSFSFIYFAEYLNMCKGKTNCYLLFADGSQNSRINAKIPEIEKYLYIIPYATEVQLNIGWAQAHSQAFSYRIWNSFYYANGYAMSDPPVIADLSFVRSALNGNFTNCKSPLLQDPSQNFLIHLPFFYSDDWIHRVYQRPALTYNNYNMDQWCDKTFLNQDLSQYGSYVFSGYDNYRIAPDLTYKGWMMMVRAMGVGLVSIPHDMAMAARGAYFSDGFYKLSGPMIYYYPANVVGCYIPGNGTAYLIVYAFGAQNPNTNYLFVDFKMVSIKGWLTYLYQLFLLR